jgi:two-component system, NtrC family, response regulator HydG
MRRSGLSARCADPSTSLAATPESAGALNCAHSSAMRRVFELASRVAALDSTILITGESGVGKERLARWLHAASHRARGPFLAINCGALSDSLLESELFGHVRGAFTGATDHRQGVFEAAAGGTLLLDEIGDASAPMQVKLLRVLQERELCRVGESKPRPIDVRLLAATHRNLRQELAQGRFREDLYYRLSVIELHIPPLRERPEDLSLLVRELLVDTAARLRRAVIGYAPDALTRLLEYGWPGNIRELCHAIERACAVATTPYIDVEDLPEAISAHHNGEIAAHSPLLVMHATAHVQTTLQKHGGNRLLAARELGISVSTLKRRLRLLRGLHGSAAQQDDGGLE